MLGTVPIAHDEYVIAAPRQRVWDLLASTIIQCMPVEQMQVLNDTTMRAVLRFRLFGIEVPLGITLRVADIVPPESFETLVTVKKAMFESSLRVSYMLHTSDGDHTRVVCAATQERGNPVFALLRTQQRAFAGEMFDSVKKELERSC